jgi:hypothetical protein
MNFNETLTVRIEGDSSGLDTALDGVVRRVDELQGRLQRVSNAAAGLDGIASRLTAAVAPAESLTRSLDRVTASIQAIGRTPITLNTAPALAALSQLNAQLEGTSSRVRGLGQGGGGGFFGNLPSSLFGSGARQPPRLADGGLVRGPSGTDRVPAWLTAGEYVVSRPAVERVGLEFLEGLNSVGALARRGVAGETVVGGTDGVGASVPRGESPVEIANSAVESPRTVGVTVMDAGRGLVASEGSREAEPAVMPVVNHFGGVTIQVREVAEMGAVVRELRTQGLAARNRRG